MGSDLPASRNKPRVGLIVPSVQSVTEPLFNRICGNEFDFLAHRMRLSGGRVEDLIEMESRLPEAVAALADAGVSLLVYCCAGSGAIQGREKEEQLCESVRRSTSIPMISTMLSCVKALDSLAAQKICLISPNSAAVSNIEVEYLCRNGFQVLSEYGFGIVDGRQFPNVPAEEIKERALSNWDDRAQALFISCMNWRAARVAPDIREKIGKPVVTSHTATLWAICCAINGAINYGQFFDNMENVLRNL